LNVGSALAAIPLPLTPEQTIVVNLDQTYTKAAEDAYLS